MTKQIIFIAQQLEAGGLEKAVITLANALAERDDYKIQLFIILHSKPIVNISKKVTVHFLTKRVLKKETRPERYIRKLIELRAVKKIIKKIHNSLVISTRNEYSTIISRKTDKTNYTIAQLHNDYSPKEFKDFCNKYQHINAFVLLNETFKEEIEPAMRKKNSFTQVLVIPNFIERQFYEEVSRENFIIAVGGFNKVKGFDRLIEIWKMICDKKVNNWKLLIGGDGKEFENIKRIIHEKNMDGKVELLGRLSNEEVFTYMLKSKIYTLSSYSEAHPFVSLEAMHNKLPVVAFDVRTGPRNIIIDGETGFLVKDGDLAEYANKIELLMNNQELWQKMSYAAYLNSEKYLKENVIKQWYELIDNSNIGDINE